MPEGIDVTLKENGVHSYKVFFFERPRTMAVFISPAHYAEQAMSGPDHPRHADPQGLLAFATIRRWGRELGPSG